MYSIKEVEGNGEPSGEPLIMVVAQAQVDLNSRLWPSQAHILTQMAHGLSLTYRLVCLLLHLLTSLLLSAL